MQKTDKNMNLTIYASKTLVTVYQVKVTEEEYELIEDGQMPFWDELEKRVNYSATSNRASCFTGNCAAL